MGEVHDILAARGKQAALDGGLSRNVVETATTYMGNEEGGIGFLYSGWCQAALPHKRTPDDQPWRVDVERISLLIEPGRRMEPGRTVLARKIHRGCLLAYRNESSSTSGCAGMTYRGHCEQWSVGRNRFAAGG